jgi:hypothetical protein
MKKKLRTLIILVILFSCLNLITAPLTALGATDPCGSTNSISAGVECFGKTAFGQEEPTNLVIIIADIINVLLGLLAVIFLVLIIFGGFTWMTAMGQEDKIKKAKQTITSAVIGLLIVLLSYAIVNLIIFFLNQSNIFYGSTWY